MTGDERTALLDDIDEALDNLGPSRPSAPKVTRARTLLKGIKVACQNIAISPVTDDGEVVVPPTPGPETPPVEPAPPETPPSGGGGGGSTSPPTTTTVTTTYTSAGDFTGSQGYRGWYYLSEDETELTYSAGAQLWSGSELYQGIWSSGQHPGNTHGAMRRWVAQATGTYSITGTTYDADTSGAGNGVTVLINQGGTALYTRAITDGDATPTAFSLSGSCTAGDEFDFIVKSPGNVSFDSTALSVSIALTTTTTSGGGSSTQTALPFTLNGTAPEEGTYTITANKPSNADGCTIAITGVNLAASYGRVYFNGSSNSLAVWETNPSNAGVSATVNLAVPVAYMTNGSNTLRFTHDSGTGYTITAIGAPSFTTPSTPTPPATQTSLPFDLRGVILPEDAILTVSLSKPSNANGATMTVTGVNLTGTMGSYYINGQLAGAIWDTVPANAGVSSTVTLSPNVTLFQNGNNAIRFTHTSGSGYTVSSVHVTFSTPSPGTDPGPPAGNNGAFLNEPSGLTVRLNHNFNVLLGTNMFNPFPGGTSPTIVSDSTAPLSPSSVMRSRLEAGALNGGAQLEWNSPTTYNRLFVGKWWRTNAGFQGRTVGNKMFFVRGAWPGGPVNTYNGVFLFNSTSLVNGTGTLRWSFNTGGLNNAHITGDPDPGVPLTSNVGDPTLRVGIWTKLEAYFVKSTTSTSQDGTIKAWINGNLVMNYTNVNYGSAGFNNWTWSETWDGTPGFTFATVPWEHYLDHLYISGA